MSEELVIAGLALLHAIVGVLAVFRCVAQSKCAARSEEDV